MGTHLKRLGEVLLMSTHNICIRREIRKILCGYPLLSVAMYKTCVIREDSGQPVHPCSLIRLCWLRVPSTVSRLSKEGQLRTLAILGGCTDWSDSLLFTQVLSCVRSYIWGPFPHSISHTFYSHILTAICQKYSSFTSGEAVVSKLFWSPFSKPLYS